MTTLRDLARATGYSMTTVSRALRGFDDVTEETRRQIEAVARAMKYRPNQTARKLATGRSGLVGLILNAPPKPFEAGHFLEFITGLSMAFAARDLDLVLHVGNGSDMLLTHERLIRQGGLDGFVLTYPVLDDPRIDLFLEHEAAFVVQGHQRGDDRYAYFDTDNHAVSVEAVGILAQAGHRRIGLIAGPPEWPSVCERVRGFREAMATHGLEVDVGLIVHGDTSSQHGARAMATFLDLGPTRPTAIVCCNALVAAGLLDVAREQGVSVPADLSLVAHDEALPQVQAAALSPPLTVTRLPLRDNCEPLADLLIRRIAGEPVVDLQVTRPPELVWGSSVVPR